ncbi:uncharacterized protein PGTG_15117 [Puccinia graminis f. sp. tritici CRL 75-36-700-3]|uniref:LSM complex subunit LSM4 n=1 Tax=Puccinia graminis f. sp. tritici (strain CRL 75-36-700-3 / race SCCL) TaxID=418459 RepID=E3KXF6_PUCGT|nr:uncharacterized protein PGTG_15117 [Puccinia graminis f. sp. tritici CRL 75-36-700-3]EFP88914.2 hypothetical protein PGTG_15117 [Puccinia graminis f. sp. tritici CRL 75-36-700-3]
MTARTDVAQRVLLYATTGLLNSSDKSGERKRLRAAARSSYGWASSGGDAPDSDRPPPPPSARLVDDRRTTFLDYIAKSKRSRTHPNRRKTTHRQTTQPPMLPLALLHGAQGKPMLVELKNGETFNGHLIQCDNFMNLTMREVYQTSANGEQFWKLPECYIRGNTIKYIRVTDNVIDQVKQQEDAYRQQNRSSRGGGNQTNERGGRGGSGGRGYSNSNNRGGPGSNRGGGGRGNSDRGRGRGSDRGRGR